MQWVFESLFYGDIEPKLDTGGNEINGKEKQHARWQKSEGDESDNESRTEPGAQHFSFPVIEELYKISQNKKNQ